MQIRIILFFICTLAPVISHAQALTEAHPGGTFVDSSQCIACHSNLAAANGEDVSIGYAWRGSIMANSGRDPYWHAAVRREVMDNPSAQAFIEDKCATCHMPMARFSAVQRGEMGKVFDNIFPAGADSGAHDGVSCTVCHQIEPSNFGQESSFTGGFQIDTSLPAGVVYAAHDVDAGRQRVMQSASGFQPTQSTHVQRSELCATCHTLYTHALNEQGEEVGAILPEQVPYLEWQHSAYRDAQSCQDCHMPVLAGENPISSILGQPRPGFSQHVFRGGNFLMLGIMNRHRNELGVTALPQDLELTIQRTRQYLAEGTATISLELLEAGAEGIEFAVSIESLSGHKLPTAYPARRAWLHVVVEDAAGHVLFESGAPQPNGSIAGNDNDLDGTRFEPHYERITEPGQVQIYEPILGDYAGRVTTGLLRGARYLKDNRILPRGFDKSNAPADIAVHGGAATDANFVGGHDRIVFAPANTAGAARVRVELLYQGIGFRWAENLREYSAVEPERFVRYYAEAAAASFQALARADLTLPSAF